VFCIQVWWVTLFALDALAVAAQSLVASSLGAGDVPRARGAADRCLKWALAAGTAVGVGEFLLTRVWAIGLTACFSNRDLRGGTGVTGAVHRRRRAGREHTWPAAPRRGASALERGGVRR
jgi:hypothetical protein